MARDNGVHESFIDECLILGHNSLVLSCLIIEHLNGSINKCADSAVNSASSAVAAIVTSEDVASAAESIRVEGAHWGRRNNDVEQAAPALLEGGTRACHTAGV